MRTDLLERDLDGILKDAEGLHSAAGTVRVGGADIRCEPAQPYDGLSPDFTGEWGNESARIIVRTRDIPRGVGVGAVCLYDGRRRRITGAEANVDGLTVEWTLGGVK